MKEKISTGAQFIELPELREESDASVSKRDSVLRDWSPLNGVKAHLEVCVGQATITIGELLSAKKNQVLRLDRHVSQPVDLCIQGKVVARGQLVAIDGYFAVRITEVPIPLDLIPGA